MLLTTGRSLDDIVGVATEVTRQRRMETEAASRNRLQALGELAGGIAHDFNNILTVINGTTDLLLDVDDLPEIRARLGEVKASGGRAADLVRRLLMFGRRDHRADEPTDLNRPIRDLHQFFRRLVGETHEVIINLHEEPLGVPIDHTDTEQVLSNLVINARDAMPEGGIIRVTTEVEVVEGQTWAVLTVQDNGIGMDEATRARVFEPFFTTKEAGDGSGLGLSTVWGIVSGSGGRIDVQSRLGQGTTMTARWPRMELVPVAPQQKATSPVSDGRSILVVEDDAGVAHVTKKILVRAGYRVRVAADGREAVQIFREQPEAFDLVFSDLVLPNLSGLDMAQEIRDMCPSIRFGFCTGYANHPSFARMRTANPSQLLRKPYTQRQLHDFVNDCMSEER